MPDLMRFTRMLGQLEKLSKYKGTQLFVRTQKIQRTLLQLVQQNCESEVKKHKQDATRTMKAFLSDGDAQQSRMQFWGVGLHLFCSHELRLRTQEGSGDFLWRDCQ
eukprot:1181770-Rhodomonas_salina.1